MARKYIDELGIERKDTPQGWNRGDERQKHWAEQRKEYGFDSRETWALDYSLCLWLYERLKMYDEVNCILTTDPDRTFKYKGGCLTLQQCIDRMLLGLRYHLTLDDHSDEWRQHQEEIFDVFPILALCWRALWW
jgi:hypothetical protein